MAKYYKRVGPTQITNTTGTIFTVTTAGVSDEQWVVRHIRLTNTSGGVDGCTISVGAIGSTTQIRNASQTMANGASEDIYCNLVFNMGEIMQAVATVSGINITIDIDRYIIG